MVLPAQSARSFRMCMPRSLQVANVGQYLNRIHFETVFSVNRQVIYLDEGAILEDDPTALEGIIRLE